MKKPKNDSEQILELRNRLIEDMAELNQYAALNPVLTHAITICISKEVDELRAHTARQIMNKIDEAQAPGIK